MNVESPRIPWCRLGLLCALAIASSCAAKPYRYGKFSDSAKGLSSRDSFGQVTFKHGEANKTLDRLSDVVSWPTRTLRPDKPDNRRITDDTTERVRRYLARNDLSDVQVAVRDYDPSEQWRRLRVSRVVPPLTRYSVGTLSVLGYSLLPGQIFGRNAYNPYTNTLYFNSDSPALLLHEAAYAKNLRQQPLPGVYALASHVPFLSVWREVDSVRDVLAYSQAEDDWELEQESYREVFPRVGSQATGGVATLMPVWWGGPVLGLAGAAAGSVAGKTALARRERHRKDELDGILESQVTGVRQVTYEEPVATDPDDSPTGQTKNSDSARHTRRAARRDRGRAENAPVDP